MNCSIESFITEKSNLSYRPIIVWAINDKMEAQEIRTQLLDFAATGYGGVMVMPWGGLPYSFMDAQWTDAVDYIMECASGIGLDIWIWDDWCYGSGFAGGLLARDHPEFRAQSLKVFVDIFIEAGETLQFIVPQRVLAASVFEIDKFGNPIGEAFDSLEVVPDQQITLDAERRKRLVVVGWEYLSGMHHTPQSHGSFMDNSLTDAQIGVRIWDDREAWGVDMLNPAATKEYLRLIHERYYGRSAKYFGNTLKGFFFDEPKVPTMRPWTPDFAERFRQNKSYNILKYLPSMLLDYKMDNANFNSSFRPENIKKAEADYADAWTTMFAESFYNPLNDWCKAHNVFSVGHPIGDGSAAEHEELFSCGGVYYKNMARSALPGIDTVWGTIVPGRFVDNPRFAGSIAASNGLDRALSESFAVWGHGTDIDAMRYTCEHQIVRGVNTFFCKLSNYNREKSLLFHSPELSGYNPIIKHYGAAFSERIDRVARLMNAGKSVPRAAVYIELENYYQGDDSPAELLGIMAEKLTYKHVEYNYVYAPDILGLACNDGAIQNRHGQVYHSILVLEQSMLPSTVKTALACFGDRVHYINKSNLDQVLENVKGQVRLSWSVVSAPSRISSLTRILTQEISCAMFLNESSKGETLSLLFPAQTSIGLLDPNTGQIDALGGMPAGERLDISLVSGESKFLVFDTSVGLLEPTVPQSFSSQKQLIQNWTIRTPDGMHLKLGKLTDWTVLKHPDYTGFMRYSTTFYARESGEAVVTLGDVCYAATVFLDGKKIGDCLFQPFEIRLGPLSRGEHLLEIDVLNTMANAIYGDENHYKELRESGALNGTYAEFYEKRDRLKLRSGLFGPVWIHWNGNQSEMCLAASAARRKLAPFQGPNRSCGVFMQ